MQTKHQDKVPLRTRQAQWIEYGLNRAILDNDLLKIDYFKRMRQKLNSTKDRPENNPGAFNAYNEDREDPEADQLGQDLLDHIRNSGGG